MEGERGGGIILCSFSSPRRLSQYSHKARQLLLSSDSINRDESQESVTYPHNIHTKKNFSDPCGMQECTGQMKKICVLSFEINNEHDMTYVIFLFS